MSLNRGSTMWSALRIDRSMPTPLGLLAVLAMVALGACAPADADGILPADLERFELIPDADADCGAFSAELGIAWEDEPAYYQSLEQLLEGADVIAMGVIEAVLPPRYWTRTGAAPADPDSDGMAIFRPVVVHLDEDIAGEDRLEAVSYSVVWETPARYPTT